MLLHGHGKAEEHNGRLGISLSVKGNSSRVQILWRRLEIASLHPNVHCALSDEEVGDILDTVEV